MSIQPKHVIVVGGGGSGAQLAKSLALALPHSYKLILISSRNYFTHLPGALRMLTTDKGELEGRVLLPYDNLFESVGIPSGKAEFKQGTLKSIRPNKPSEGPPRGGTIILDSSEEIPYEVLVLATGSKWEGGLDLPDSLAEAKKSVNEWRKKIEESKGVVIVGGGAVGTEFAGEIRDVYPDKPITIIHNQPHLLNPTYPLKFRKDVEYRWLLRSIHLVLGDSLDPGEIEIQAGGSAVTKGGVRVDGDLVIPCRGGHPNTSFLNPSTSPAFEGVLTSSGHVKVEESLQVVGFPGIYASGDIISWPEIKQVAKYPGHAKVIQANVLSYLSSPPPSSSGNEVKYRSMFEAIFLTNGAEGGAAYLDILWGLSFGNWVTKTLKSQDLFVSRSVREMGY